MRPAAEPETTGLESAPAEGSAPRARARSRYSASQATPLVVGGLMYVSTPYRRVVALDADLGREAWAYEVPGPGQPSLRGVEYWPGDAEHGPRIFFGTRDGRLIALDAKSGAPAADFASGGILDLKTPDVAPSTTSTEPRAQYGLTSPPLVYENLVITGSATQEFPERGAAGDVRAWDARTGDLVWTFHTVPRPGELGHGTWGGAESWRERSGVNVWGFMTVDVARGILYAPIAAPAWDRYGGDRPGDNLFSSSVVALDAQTGERLWHFQVVHHDIWDFDTEAPPVLLDAPRRDGVTPAVAVVSKSGYFFLLDRVSGKPLFEVEERRVPASEVRRREGRAHTADSGEARALCTHAILDERYRDRDARARSVLPRVDSGIEHANGRAVSADRQRADDHVSRPTRRRKLGRRLLRPRAKVVLRQREQSGPCGAAPPTGGRHDVERRARRRGDFPIASESSCASNRRGEH